MADRAALAATQTNRAAELALRRLAGSIGLIDQLGGGPTPLLRPFPVGQVWPQLTIDDGQA